MKNTLPLKSIGGGAGGERQAPGRWRSMLNTLLGVKLEPLPSTAPARVVRSRGLDDSDDDSEQDDEGPEQAGMGDKPTAKPGRKRKGAGGVKDYKLLFL